MRGAASGLARMVVVVPLVLPLGCSVVGRLAFDVTLSALLRPPVSRVRAPADDGPRAPPGEVTGPGHRFVLPTGWWRDKLTKHEVYRAPDGRHVVRIRVVPWTYDEREWIVRNHPTWEARWEAKAGDRTAIVFTKVGTLRVTAAVITADEEVYELACSQDVPGEKVDAICAAILRTFRVD